MREKKMKRESIPEAGRRWVKARDTEAKMGEEISPKLHGWT